MQILSKLKNRPEMAGWGILAIILCVIGFNLLNRQTFNNLNQSFDTIYEDRLMPAVYIYELSDMLHFNRLYMDRHIRTTDASVRNEISTQMYLNHLKIDSILHRYDQTYLTTHESEVYADLKIMLLDYRRMEKNLLQRREPVAYAQVTEEKMDLLFQKALDDLKLLALEQQVVGHEIKLSTSGALAGNITLADLEISILFILLILLKYSIFRATRSLVPAKEQINWN